MNPNASVIHGAWEGLKALPVLVNAAEAVDRAENLLSHPLS
jgi:hypothetical protein